MNTPLDCNGAEQALAECLSQPASTAPTSSAPGLTEHLATCAPCRRYEAETRALLVTLRDQAVLDPGPSYWRRFPERVREAVGNSGRRRSALLGWPAWTGLAAAALLAVFLIRPLIITTDTDAIMPPDAAGNDVAARAEAFGEGATLTEAGHDEPAGAADITDRFAELASSLAAIESDEATLDSVLDDLLGGPSVFDLSPEIDDLSPEQQRELLDTLRAALDEPA